MVPIEPSSKPSEIDTLSRFTTAFPFIMVAAAVRTQLPDKKTIKSMK